MNKYQEPIITVLYLEQADVITMSTSSDGAIVEPGDGWED